VDQFSPAYAKVSASQTNNNPSSDKATKVVNPEVEAPVCSSLVMLSHENSKGQNKGTLNEYQIVNDENVKAIMGDTSQNEQPYNRLAYSKQ